MQKTIDGSKIGEPDHTYLKALLAHHSRSNEKLANLDHFTTGIHPVYSMTRCFFVVKSDGTKEDFSAAKCINSMAGR